MGVDTPDNRILIRGRPREPPPLHLVRIVLVVPSRDNVCPRAVWIFPQLDVVGLLVASFDEVVTDVIFGIVERTIAQPSLARQP